MDTARIIVVAASAALITACETVQPIPQQQQQQTQVSVPLPQPSSSSRSQSSQSSSSSQSSQSSQQSQQQGQSGGQQSSQSSQQASQSGQQSSSQGGMPQPQSGQQASQSGQQSASASGQQSSQSGQQSASTSGSMAGGSASSGNRQMPVPMPGSQGANGSEGDQGSQGEQGEQGNQGEQMAGNGEGDSEQAGGAGSESDQAGNGGTEANGSGGNEAGGTDAEMVARNGGAGAGSFGNVDGLFGTEESFGSNRPSGAEEALGEALGDFDEAMSREQEALGREGGGQGADEAVAQGSGTDAGSGSPINGEGLQGNQTQASRSDRPDPRLDPNSTGAPAVEGCDDEDNTARTICELATVEEDPFVKADLWEEYNEYVRLIRGR